MPHPPLSCTRNASDPFTRFHRPALPVNFSPAPAVKQLPADKQQKQNDNSQNPSPLRLPVRTGRVV
ncbi:hypothetical protein, partial [Cronobacter sakazakii]|uniref:hypothetical protein n=1 Tax=Cronobacter sakazakii TaxID=28141 RepID=UPI001F42EE32